MEWVKKHKLASILLIGILLYFFSSILSSFFFGSSLANLSFPSIGENQDTSSNGSFGALRSGNSMQLHTFGFNQKTPPAPPPIDQAQQSSGSSGSQNRLVTHEGNVSLLVSNVQDTSNKILNYTNVNGGYMISSEFSNPGEAPTATITVRVPSAQLDAALAYFRQQSLQVVSENLTGDDITDQYKDIEAQLTTLNATKAKFQAIMDKTNVVVEILDIQQKIIDLQNQIDQLKGEQKYLQQSAQMSKITVYLSTDELALPYTPNDTWRPIVIFKLALRSLIGTVQGLASLLIWAIVYSVIWLPLFAIIFYIRKYRKRKAL